MMMRIKYTCFYSSLVKYYYYVVGALLCGSWAQSPLEYSRRWWFLSSLSTTVTSIMVTAATTFEEKGDDQSHSTVQSLIDPHDPIWISATNGVTILLSKKDDVKLVLW